MKNLRLNKIITVEAGKRQSMPCIRGLRISVYDVLGWIESGMTQEEIIADFPELNKRDIDACMRYAQDVQQRHFIQKK